MRFTDRLQGPWSRLLVMSLAMILLMAGASFFPATTKELRRPSRPVAGERLTGQQGAEYLKTRLARHDVLRRERQQILERLRPFGVSEKHMVVVPVSAARTRSASGRWLQQMLDPKATAQTYGIDEGVLVITPFEGDGDPMTAEFNSLYNDYDTGHYSWADVQLHTADPENTVSIWSGEIACNGPRENNGPPSLANLLSPRLYAQTH